MALLRAAAKLADLKLAGDEQIGVDVVKRACEEPLRQIVGNAGFEGAIVAEKVRNNPSSDFGFNVLSMEYEDMTKAGIIDPAKVTRSAVQNAASIAAMILTTEALVTDIKEKTPPAPPPQMPEY